MQRHVALHRDRAVGRDGDHEGERERVAGLVEVERPARGQPQLVGTGGGEQQPARDQQTVVGVEPERAGDALQQLLHLRAREAGQRSPRVGDHAVEGANGVG